MSAAALMAAGSILGAVGSISSGMAAAKQAKAQSAVMQQQAERERQEAAARERDFRRQQSALQADRRAVMGATGVEPGEGSPLLASEDFAGESELQALRIRSGGELRATRLEQEAALMRARGKQERMAGIFRAGSLLLSGGGEAWGQAKKQGGWW